MTLWQYAKSPTLCLAMATGYIVMMNFSLTFFMLEDVAIVWPANGLATAFFLAFSKRYWPSLWLGMAISYIIVLRMNHVPVTLLQLGYLLANVVSVSAAVYLFKRVCPEQISFRDIRDNVLFLMCLCLFSALINTFVGVTVYVMDSGDTDIANRSMIWFVGNSVSNFACTIPIYQLLRFLRKPNLNFEFIGQRKIELAVVCATTIVIMPLVFARQLYNSFTVSAIFIIFPLAVWVALRFNHHITSLWVNAVFLACAYFSAAELGPFVFMFDEMSVAIFYMQVFIFMACGTALVIGAINTEKESKAQTIGELNHQLEALSKIDPLTKIANRRRYDENIKDALASTSKRRKPLTVIAIDVDYFKSYNDTYGHATGDECLIKLAQAIEQSLDRSTDVVARMGGEEFFCILPETDKQGSKIVMEKIKASIRSLALPHARSPISPFVTVSMGSCTKPGDEHSCAKVLYNLADKALYSAKQRGRDTYVAVEFNGSKAQPDSELTSNAV